MSENEHSGNGGGRGNGGGGAATAASADHMTRVSVPVARRDLRLGEELPIFCERCGYSLNGLTQIRCERCDVLHFACPECNHHQPINTLRPAAQRILGRVRAFVLALWVFFKLNFFGWLLFAWFAMGVEWSYEFHSTRNPSNPNAWNYQLLPRPVDLEAVVGMSLFALAFGAVGRMLLLRWRRGYLVGLCLAALVCGGLVLGAYWRKWAGAEDVALPSPWTGDFAGVLATTGVTLMLGAMVVWGVWTALAHVFLPRRTSEALLDSQRSLSNPAAAQLARE